MPPVAAVRPSAVPLRSVALILVSMFCFPLVDALAKSLALAYPANEVTFFRMLFGLFPAVAMCLRGKPLATRLRQLDVRGQTLRALTLLGASGLFFAGLPYMPLSEAVAIVYSETLLVIVLAPLLLRETLKPRDALAAVVGFAGMLLVVRPDGSHSSWLGPALLIASALCGALSIIHPRGEVRADLSHARVSAQIDAAVPMSLTTTDAEMTVALGGSGAKSGTAIDLDAAASDGDVLASDWGLTAKKTDRDSALLQHFGDAARVSLRTSNGNIIIKKDASATIPPR